MTLADVVRDLEARGVMPKGPPSLEPTRLALSRLDLILPEDPRRVILVAGTNGKGSTSRTLETLLLSRGFRVGLYTSPHLVDIRERIRLGGEMVSESDFVAAFEAVTSRCRDLALTHFEVLTLMAAWLFFAIERSDRVEWAVIEVGLGGLWDATNAIPHGTCVITRLGLDHMDLLGSSLAEIATNKFGIVTNDALVVHQALDGEVSSLASRVGQATGSRWLQAPAFETRVDTSDRFPRWFLQSAWGEAEIPLAGPRGAENMNLALATYDALGFDARLGLTVLKRVHWPARMQRFAFGGASCPVFVSGDHNEQGAESLERLLEFYRYRKLHLVIAVGARKDLDAMMRIFARIRDCEITLTTANFQGRNREQYGSWLSLAVAYESSPLDALRFVSSRARPEDLIVMTGSLYLAGDVLPFLSPSE